MVFSIFSVDVVLTIPLQILAILRGDITSFRKDSSTSPDKNVCITSYIACMFTSRLLYIIIQNQGVIQEYYIIFCGATVYYLIWTCLSIVYKLILHIIGLVLAFLIRKIEISALNDSKYSALLIYCSSFVLILIIITIPTNVDKPNVVISLWSVIIFVVILMFLGLTFVPKVRL